VHDQRSAVVLNFGPLDDDLVDAQQGAKYPGIAHAVLRLLVPDLRQARNLGRNGVLPTSGVSRHPQIHQKSRKKGDPHAVRSRPSKWTVNASDDPAED
jgi:hypothetical protein